MSHRWNTLAAAVALAALATSGMAAPRLVSSSPQADQTVAKLARIELRFSEALGAAPAVTITMTSMPGMAHHAPMKIAGFTPALAADARTTTIALPRALPAGTYRLTWRAASASGPAEGTIGFTAR